MCATLRGRKIVYCLAALLALLCALTAPGAVARSIEIHRNNRITEELVFPFGEDDGQSYPVIAGLRDKTVQRRINKRIKALFYERLEADLPAYRGMRILARDAGWPEDVRTYVYVRVEANVDNLLCVTAGRSFSLPNARTGEETDVSDIRAVTFDLRTGEELALGDLFRAGADYQSYVQGVVSDYALQVGAADEDGEDVDESAIDWSQLRLYPSTFSQVAPFQVRDDQRFVLQGFGPYLWLALIIDDATPEFETHYQWQQITIPFCDDMDFHEKFTTRKSLFTAGDGALFFLDTPSEQTPVTLREETTQPLGADEALERHTSVILENDWPQAVKDAALRLPLRFDQTDEAVALYRAERAAGGARAMVSDFSVYGGRVGGFINFWCVDRVYALDENGDEEDLSTAIFRAAYRERDGRLVDGSMIFADDAWQETLADVLLQTIRGWNKAERAEVAPGLSARDKRWREAARVLAAHVSGFAVESTELMIAYDKDVSALLPAGIDGQALCEKFEMIPYADMGYDRLRLFDDEAA